MPSQREQIGEAFLKSNIARDSDPEVVKKSIDVAQQEVEKTLNSKLNDLQNKLPKANISSVQSAESELNAYIAKLKAETRHFSSENKAFVNNEIIPVLNEYLPLFKQFGNNLPELQAIKRQLYTQGRKFFASKNKGLISFNDYKKVNSLEKIYADMGVILKNNIEDIANAIESQAGNEIKNLNRQWDRLS